ncbi:protein SLC31A2 [Myripristis murdjan]|uniref:Copper transport protein n=1 Tax=Myripristis murdjan TaxID=586833 RepID=A0A667YYD7_9TELE|nr:probable low affinity copper uptake protein 2 [Myripristis murdjan]
MMSMTFVVSSRVKLLFDFWDVQGPAGMVLSVLVVLLLTVLYEILKVFRVWLGNPSQLLQPQSLYLPPTISSSCSSSSEHRRSSNTVPDSSRSESSLVPLELPPKTNAINNKWLLHGIQTVLHLIQVSLGYMLMLCVMSYNTWIFIGVILGSVIGYYIAFPVLEGLLGRI